MSEIHRLAKEASDGWGKALKREKLALIGFIVSIALNIVLLILIQQ